MGIMNEAQLVALVVFSLTVTSRATPKRIKPFVSGNRCACIEFSQYSSFQIEFRSSPSVRLLIAVSSSGGGREEFKKEEKAKP
jgi:hypothetical protein